MPLTPAGVGQGVGLGWVLLSAWASEWGRGRRRRGLQRLRRGSQADEVVDRGARRHLLTAGRGRADDVACRDDAVVGLGTRPDDQPGRDDGRRGLCLGHVRDDRNGDGPRAASGGARPMLVSSRITARARTDAPRHRRRRARQAGWCARAGPGASPVARRWRVHRGGPGVAPAAGPARRPMRGGSA